MTSMFCELEPEAFGAVRPLFSGLDYHIMTLAALEGGRRARVFADRPGRPRAAFIFTPQVWGYLAGDAASPGFAEELAEEVFSKHILGRGVSALFVATDPETWWERLVSVMGPFVPIPTVRLYYVCSELEFDWRVALPDGFRVEPISADLVGRPGPALPEDVKAWMEEWGSAGEFLEHGFGFLALIGDRAVSWAIADGIANGRCEIGVFTEKEYRRRRLGAVTTAAAVEHALSKGIGEVGWHCAAENEASTRTAERVGFKRQLEYEMHLILLDEARHRMQMKMSANRLAEDGEALVSRGDYRQAVGLYETVLTLNPDMGPEHYHLAARALAGEGRYEDAMEHLFAAAERGWAHTYHTRNCSEFRALRDTPQWHSLLELIEENRREGRRG
ncbi:MAG: GNAT family N-acetyltransferase [bacterium]